MTKKSNQITKGSNSARKGKMETIPYNKENMIKKEKKNPLDKEHANRRLETPPNRQHFYSSPKKMDK